MKKKLSTVLTGILFAGLIHTGRAQTVTQTVNISTGVDNAGSPIAPGNFDDTWLVKVPSSSSFVNVRCTDGTLFYNPTSLPTWITIPGVRWISPATIQNGPNHSGLPSPAAGSYVYRMEFPVNSCTINNATLLFDNLGGDNLVTNVNVNGHNHSITASSTFTSPASNISFNVSSELIAGTNNYIEITVFNSGSTASFTGLLVKGNLTVNYNQTFTTPSFTTGSYCTGDLIMVNGSGTTITGGSFGSHVWTIWECDQYGNVNPSATEWWSPWFTGAPGVYDFNGCPNLQCGKYYLVKLGLVNACEGWKQVTHVIYINCRPSVSLHGSTNEICPGETAYISPNVTFPSGLNSTVEITPGIPFFNLVLYLSPVYSGPPLSFGVTPNSTTTYRISVTDNNTGCNTTVYYTVYVKNSDPSFSLTANTANSTHLELTATPNTTTNIPTGLQYLWYVDELDVNGNLVYQVFDNTCWMNFPSVVNQVFEGVDATLPGYTGTVTCGWPTIGKFKYNTTYRITRVTWSPTCPPLQSSLIVSAAKSISGVAIYEDHNAPDYTKLAGNMAIEKTISDEVSVKVFPNPSDGQFVLEANDMIIGKADVFDAIGKKITSVVLNGSNRYNIDLSRQAKGIYTVRVVSGSLVFTEKVIVQ